MDGADTLALWDSARDSEEAAVSDLVADGAGVLRVEAGTRHLTQHSLILPTQADMLRR